MTPVDRATLVWFEAVVRSRGRRPTYREALARFGINRREWRDRIGRLVSAGMLQRTGPTARGVSLTEKGLAEATRYRLSCCEGHPTYDGVAFWAPCLACGETLEAEG